MAFATAAGYGNLPNGNFSPIIYSKKAQIAFRKTSVVQAITNTEYFGEIAAYGDTVKIIKEPQLTVAPYVRGQQINTQDLDDEELVMIIDQSNYFAFKVDDIEKKHAHINWESMASDQAGYRLKDQFDKEVLSYMLTNAPSATTIGTSGAAQGVGFSGTGLSPLTIMNRSSRMLDVNNVAREGRFFVGDPVWWEKMADEASKLTSRDWDQSEKDIIRNGRVLEGMIRGFKCYSSNNLLTGGTGPTATSGGTNYGTCIFGHISSTSTAEQINKTESYRDPDSFADVVRGMHLYGRKVLRPESLGAVYYNSVVA